MIFFNKSKNLSILAICLLMACGDVQSSKSIGVTDNGIVDDRIHLAKHYIPAISFGDISYCASLPEFSTNELRAFSVESGIPSEFLIHAIPLWKTIRKEGVSEGAASGWIYKDGRFFLPKNAGLSVVLEGTNVEKYATCGRYSGNAIGKAGFMSIVDPWKIANNSEDQKIEDAKLKEYVAVLQEVTEILSEMPSKVVVECVAAMHLMHFVSQRDSELSGEFDLWREALYLSIRKGAIKPYEISGNSAIFYEISKPTLPYGFIDDKWEQIEKKCVLTARKELNQANVGGLQ